jgi:SIR2-like domain
MEINENDRVYLKKALATNSAILFVGAGFSTGATNRLKQSIPAGPQFASALWSFLTYKGDYDGTSLQTLFEAALKRAKQADLRKLLEDTFLCSQVPQWYSFVSQIFWHRIYGTNVDDLVEQVYAMRTSIQKLKVFNAITDDFAERDQFLNTAHYVKLNGSVLGEPQNVTFSIQQYADRMNQREPWYDHFVRDYATQPTIFIGSSLNEPLLYQAVAARKSRFTEQNELRPRGFLVCRSISQPQLEALQDFRLVPLIGEAKEFFELAADLVKPFPDRETVLLSTNPDLEGMFALIKANISRSQQANLEEFYRCFSPVRQPQTIAQTRKLFLQGAEPTWSDIYNNLDAPRTFTAELMKAVEASANSKTSTLITLSGSAGSGKSTLLKRTALTLAQQGHLVFFSDSEETPQAHHVAGAIALIPKRPVLILDNISLALGRLVEYVGRCRKDRIAATFVVAGRTSKLVERLPDLKRLVELKELHMPDLSIPDIDAVIEVLERHNQPGRLANKPLHEQRGFFQSYAHHQLLVAMRWATLGRGFDEIIRGEFMQTEPLAAKMIYVCTCLVTAAQFSISKQQIIACSPVSPAETLAYLQYNLKDIVVPSDGHPDRYISRHRSIAEQIVDHVVPRPMLRDAYIRLLKVISHDLNYPVDTGTRMFRLYQRLINHTSIYRRFSAHLEGARAIYDTLTAFLKRDYHYLLQYGSLELEYGELDVAANYIEQAFAYAPDDRLVVNTRGHLLYKQAIATNLKETADMLRGEARDILLHQMESRPGDVYPKHMLCSQELNWINHWLPYAGEKKQPLTELKEFATKAAKEHSSSPDMQEIFRRINDAYLDLART